MIWMPGNEVVLFYASERLVGQVAQWLGGHQRYQLRLSESCGPVEIELAAREAATVIVDVVTNPQRAMDAMEVAIDAVGRARMGVYCESADKEVELLARMHGVTLLAGPMSAAEWQTAMASLCADETSRIAS